MPEEKKPTPAELAAASVIAANGRAPNLIDSLSPDEVAELAAMVKPDGSFAGGKVKEADGAEVEISPREAFRLFVVRHNEEKKATNAQDDPSRPNSAERIDRGTEKESSALQSVPRSSSGGRLPSN